LSKPFFYPELRARVGAVLRRTTPRQPGRVIEAGPVRIDVRRREVTVSTRVVELAAMEYELLCRLACESARVFTREELMRDVWGCTRACALAPWTATSADCAASCAVRLTGW
jgi:DNA-binding response OmpR family regulator